MSEYITQLLKKKKKILKKKRKKNNSINLNFHKNEISNLSYTIYVKNFV